MVYILISTLDMPEIDTFTQLASCVSKNCRTVGVYLDTF